METDPDTLSLEDARECAALLEHAEAAIMATLAATLERLPGPMASPRFARFLVISALLRPATSLMALAIAEHPDDRERCAGLLAEMTRQVTPWVMDTAERTH